MFKIIIISTIIFLFFAVGTLAQVITLDSSTHYQTWADWAATDWACDSPGACNNVMVNFPNTLNTAFDKLINDVGVTGYVLEVQGGIENPTDYWTLYMQGQFSDSVYINNYLYQIINDNADPQNINLGGFQFSSIDDNVDRELLPIKSLVEARGEKLTVILKYVDFPRSVRTFNLCDNPNEYAEFILAIYQHLHNKYGFVPDILDMINEPDNIANVPSGCWNSPANLGNIVKAVGDCLTANGFSAKIAVPSNANLIYASNYFDGIWANVQARQYITQISYHRYGGDSDTALQNIGVRAISNNIQSYLSELMNENYINLQKDIKLANVSAWDGTYVILGNSSVSASYLWVNTATGAVNLTDNVKYLRQYTKFIRPGAVRIDAASNDSNFSPVAFINLNGKYAVVINTTLAGALSVQGLPAATYGIKYTTASQYDKDLTDVVLQPGQILTTNIPAAGVITVYAKSIAPPDTTPPAAPSGVTVN